MPFLSTYVMYPQAVLINTEIQIEDIWLTVKENKIAGGRNIVNRFLITTNSVRIELERN